MTLFWTTEEGDAGRVVCAQAEGGQNAVQMRAIALGGASVVFPPPGGGVAVVPVGGGGLQELRGTTDGEVLTWDAGLQQWVPGAGAVSSLAQASEVDDFRGVTGLSMASTAVELGPPSLPTQLTTPWWGDLPWVAYTDNGQGNISYLAAQANNPGIINVGTSASGSNDKVWCYRGAGNNSARNSGNVFLVTSVLEHHWILRATSTNGSYRFGLVDNPDFSQSAATFNTGAFRGLLWLNDSAQAPNSNLWACAGRLDGVGYNTDTGLTAAQFTSSPLRRYTIRQNQAFPGTFEFLIDGVLVATHAPPWDGTERVKPFFWILTKNGTSVNMHIDYYQTTTVQLTR